MVKTGDCRRSCDRPHVSRQIVDLRFKYLPTALRIDLLSLGTGFTGDSSTHGEYGSVGKEDCVDVHALMVQRTFGMIGRVH